MRVKIDVGIAIDLDAAKAIVDNRTGGSLHGQEERAVCLLIEGRWVPVRHKEAAQVVLDYFLNNSRSWESLKPAPPAPAPRPVNNLTPLHPERLDAAASKT